MFALIDTKGASHIAIYVPHDFAAESLPALARMLEQNAKFVKIGWREIDMTTPEMSIILGDKYTLKDGDVELVITPSAEVIGPEFVEATPLVFLANKKALAKKEEEISRLRKELEYKNTELDKLEEKIASLTEPEE